MISEKKFSNSYHAFWQEILPWSTRAIKFLNLGLTERFSDPITAITPTSCRGFINELAFQACAADPKSYREVGAVVIAAETIAKTKKRIQLISQYDDALPTPEFEVDAIKEAAILAASTKAFFRMFPVSQDIVFSPYFPGCGILDSCEGDAILQKTLVEFKAGDRHFRVADIRQLLCYAALNRAAGAFDVERIALANPRTGLSFISNLDEFCELVSGLGSAELLDQIIWFLSSQEQQQ